MNRSLLVALFSSAVAFSINAIAPEPCYATAWTCDLVAAGPPGGCPDCIFLCGRLLNAYTLELALYVDKAQSGVLCSADVFVEQDDTALFDDTVIPTSPISLSLGWHALDTVDIAGSDPMDPIDISGSGQFAVNAGACD